MQLQKPTAKNILAAVILTIPLIAASAALYAIHHNANWILFPSNHPVQFTAYSDSSRHDQSQGTSTVEPLKVTDRSIHLTYTLHHAFAYPYAGLRINTRTPNHTTDIRFWDDVVVTVDSATSPSARFMLQTFVPGVSNWADRNSFRPLTREIELSRSSPENRIPIRSFATAIWWYQFYNSSETKIGPPDLSRLVDLEIESGDLTPIDTVQYMLITRIALQRHTLIPSLAVAGALIFIYLLIGLIYLLLRRMRPAPVITYEKIAVESHKDEEIRRIAEIIGSGFTNTDLTVGRVADGAGVTVERVAQRLRSGFGMTFRQYLNAIRIEEAKRILKETDLQVNEVFHKVGYGSVTHFHRVFKEVAGCSPNEYRSGNS